MTTSAAMCIAKGFTPVEPGKIKETKNEEGRIPQMSYPGYEYPTEEQLKKIISWPWTDAYGLAEYIKGIWWLPEWGYSRRGRKWELHTGGWSGNESIIYALQENRIIWTIIWVKSERGGHYWFELPAKTKREGLK